MLVSYRLLPELVFFDARLPELLEMERACFFCIYEGKGTKNRVSCNANAVTSVVFGGPLFIPIAFTLAVAMQQHRLCGFGNGAGRLIAVLCAYLMAISPGFPFPGYFAPLTFLSSVLVPWRQSRKRSARRIHFFSLLLCFNNVHDVFDYTRGSALRQVIDIQSEARKIVDGNYKCDRRFLSRSRYFRSTIKLNTQRITTGPFLLFLAVVL